MSSARERRAAARESLHNDTDFQEQRVEWQAQHSEAVSGARGRIDGDLRREIPAIRDWVLDSPLTILNYSQGGYRIDFVVEHGLRADTKPDPEGRARVLRLLKVEREDGEPLNRLLKLDMEQLALDGIALHSRSSLSARVEQPDGTEIWVTGPHWSVHAAVVRHAARAAGMTGRVRWTSARDQALMQHYTAAVEEESPHAARDAADAMGLPPGRVHARLSYLRGQGWDLKPAKVGRPPGPG